MLTNQVFRMSQPNATINSENSPAPSESSPSRLGRLSTFISAIIVGGILLIVTGVTIYTWATKITWGDSEKALYELPIVGGEIQIDNIKTYWTRVPNEGESHLSATFYPTAEITINKKSRNGKIRCLYQNESDQMTGNSVSATFSNGKFPTGKTLTYTATDGIKSEPIMNGYLADLNQYWYLRILEGTQDAESMGDFVEIAKIPIGRTLSK